MTRSWGVRFEYDASNDVVYAYPCGSLKSQDDADAFNAEIVAYYKQFGRRMDAIVVMEMFTGSSYDSDAYETGIRAYIKRTIIVSHGISDASNIARLESDYGDELWTAPDTASALELLRKLRANA